MSKVMEPEVDERVEQFASACVLSTKGASLLDTSTLAAAGLRTRTSPACMTDVLITSASLAFILQNGLELVTPSDTEAFWDRSVIMIKSVPNWICMPICLKLGSDAFLDTNGLIAAILV